MPLNFAETPSTEGSSAAQPASVASNAQSTTNPAAERLTPRTAPADASVPTPDKGVLAPLHGSAQQSTAADTHGDAPKPHSPSPATASLNNKAPMTAPVSIAELIIAAAKRSQPVNRQSSTPVTVGASAQQQGSPNFCTVSSQQCRAAYNRGPFHCQECSI